MLKCIALLIAQQAMRSPVTKSPLPPLTQSTPGTYNTKEEETALRYNSQVQGSVAQGWIL